MMIGTAHLLEGILHGQRWGIDQDFGYLWQLEVSPGQSRTFSLHLRCDPVDDHAPGLLYARERGSSPEPHGAIVAAQVSPGRVASLIAVVLDDRGVGDLRQLGRLLDMVAATASAAAC